MPAATHDHARSPNDVSRADTSRDAYLYSGHGATAQIMRVSCVYRVFHHFSRASHMIEMLSRPPTSSASSKRRAIQAAGSNNVRNHFADFMLLKHVGEPITAQEQRFTILHWRTFIDVRGDSSPREPPAKGLGNLMRSPSNLVARCSQGGVVLAEADLQSPARPRQSANSVAGLCSGSTRSGATAVNVSAMQILHEDPVARSPS